MPTTMTVFPDRLSIMFVNPVPYSPFISQTTRSLKSRRNSRSCRRIVHACAQPQKPRKIAIAGAGIAGLSTAIALVKTAGISGESIEIYEPRPGLDSGLGAAVNLNGGSAVLSKYYDVSLRHVGIPINRVVSRSVSGRTLFDVDVALAYGAYGSDDLLDSSGNSLAQSVMRDDLQSVLTRFVKEAGVVIQYGKHYAVRDVLVGDGVAQLELVGGSVTKDYDLVIGADGVRSSIRAVVSGSETAAQYTGFRVQWAMCPRNVRSEYLPYGEVHQWFGDGGYALHYAAGAVGNTCEMLALSHRDERLVEENVEYRSEEALRARMEERLKSCGMPTEILNVFNSADRFIETGVYSHGLTSKWSRDGVCVLVGDSGT